MRYLRGEPNPGYHSWNNTLCLLLSEATSRKKYSTVSKERILPETSEILVNHLRLEYDFYQFVRQRFYNIYKKVQRINDQTFLDGIWGSDEEITRERDDVT